MRELLIDFNSENPLSAGDEAGYIGENNATMLVIRPSEEMLGSQSEFFVAVFLTDGKIYRSEQLAPAREMRILLGAHLTQDHYLSMQLEGYSEENMLIYKSPTVSKIRFMPSIEGKECTEDVSEYTLKGNIEINRKNRHSHKNEDILKNLDESDGMLTYNGMPVSSQKNEKVVVLSCEKGEVDATNISRNGLGFKIVTFDESAETFPFSENTEILSVELNIDDENLPEWLDIRDMYAYDVDHPYVVKYRKPFFSDYYGGIIAVVHFLGAVNHVADCLNAGLLRNVRVTYIER